MFDKEAIQELALGRAGAINAAYGALPALVKLTAAALPNDFTLHDLEKFGPNRRRARGTMRTSDLSAFADYVQEHAEPGATVFVAAAEMQAVAVLNLGTTVAPGHADNRAQFEAKKTAAYKALLAITFGPKTQLAAAEFVEDWQVFIACVDGTGGVIPTKQAVASIRRITIESLNKRESEVQRLSAEATTFEKVAATSKDPLPDFVHFTCEPYLGLPERTFVLRLGIQTGAKDPQMLLRMVQAELHEQEMAEELRVLIVNAVPDSAPVLVGVYAPAT